MKEKSTSTTRPYYTKMQWRPIEIEQSTYHNNIIGVSHTAGKKQYYDDGYASINTAKIMSYY